MKRTNWNEIVKYQSLLKLLNLPLNIFKKYMPNQYINIIKESNPYFISFI